MTREKKVTIRLSDQELSDLTEQMKKEDRFSTLPAAMKGVQKESTLSAFIREKSLSAGPGKELKKIRLVLTHIDTMMQQMSAYLKRNPKAEQNGSLDTSFTELCRELREIRKQIERMEGDGGNGTETH